MLSISDTQSRYSLGPKGREKEKKNYEMFSEGHFSL